MRAGFTLIELLLTIAILGLAAGVAALALRAGESRAPHGWREQLLAARTRAITTGAAVTEVTDSVGRFTAYPSGLLIADSMPRLHLGPPAHAP